MRTPLAIACLLALCLVPSPGGAFDHERKGFLLGGGTGIGAQAPLLQTVGQERLAEGALATSIRMGWGLNSKTEVYVHNGGVTGFGFFYVPIPYTTAVTVIGVRRYLHETPSFYASAGAGLGSWSVFGITAGAGFGTLANVGYEYRKHWSLELEGTYANLGRPGEPFEASDASKPFTVAMKFSGTAY